MCQLKVSSKVDLLIVDELLFQLLASRYETTSTIITSNLGFSDWVKVFHDKTLTAVWISENI